VKGDVVEKQNLQRGAGLRRAIEDDFAERRFWEATSSPSRSAVTVFKLTLLKDQVSGERTGRSRCRRPLTVRDDRVRDV
jgi:hypothetical protein